MKPPKNQLDTKKGLAARLGVTRTTLDGYLNQPDAPQAKLDGKFDVLEVTAYIQDHPKSERTAVKSSEGLRELKERELRLKCEKLQLQVEAERGLFIRKTTAEETTSIIIRTIMAKLRRVLEVELPPKLVGLDVIGMTERMKQATDGVARELSDRMTWNEPKA